LARYWASFGIVFVEQHTALLDGDLSLRSYTWAMSRPMGVRQAEQFISGDLKRQLRRDLREVRILREGDLECCVYFHLRRKLGSDWSIFSRKYVKQTGHFVDFVLFHKGKPRLAMEIKWRYKAIQEKDRSSLRKILDHKHIKKAYFLTALPDKNVYINLRGNKRKTEKNRLVELRVGLDWGKKRVKKWQEKRYHFTRRMGLKVMP
jgi:hypothetical protein